MVDAWNRIPAKDRIPIGGLLTSLEAWKATEDWRKQDGEFVPAVDRWIRDRKWADPPEPTPKPPGRLPRRPDSSQWQWDVQHLHDDSEKIEAAGRIKAAQERALADLR